MSSKRALPPTAEYDRSLFGALRSKPATLLAAAATLFGTNAALATSATADSKPLVNCNVPAPDDTTGHLGGTGTFKKTFTIKKGGKTFKYPFFINWQAGNGEMLAASQITTTAVGRTFGPPVTVGRLRFFKDGVPLFKGTKPQGTTNGLGNEPTSYCAWAISDDPTQAPDMVEGTALTKAGKPLGKATYAVHIRLKGGGLSSGAADSTASKSTDTTPATTEPTTTQASQWDTGPATPAAPTGNSASQTSPGSLSLGGLGL